MVEGREIDDEGRDENVVYGKLLPGGPGCGRQRLPLEGDEDSQPGDIVRVRAVAGFAYDVVTERVNESNIGVI